MAPLDKKRLLLLCGASLLAIQLVGRPSSLLNPSVSVALKAAQADESSCFVAGTRVLMADGSERPIDSVRAGDAVLGRCGRVNRVVASERTSLGRRRLYAFNGGQPFVTAEHPFLTCEGWKALDPEATRRENDRLHVAALQPGDRVCRAVVRRVEHAGAQQLLFLQSAMVLEALAAVEADPGTPLFNLLLDGDHSYVADGWIVHNKEGAAEGGGSSGAAPAGEVMPSAQGSTGPSGAQAAARSQSPRQQGSQSELETFMDTLGVDDPRDVGLQPAGPPLSPDQEREVIQKQWQQPN